MTTTNADVSGHISQVLEELGRGLGVDLTLDDEGECYFEHADGWRMAILYPGEDQIVTAVSVMSGIDVSDEEILSVLVKFGWLGTQSDGAALSWNPETRSFVLWYSRDALRISEAELNALLLRLCREVADVRPMISDRLYSQIDSDQDGLGYDSPNMRV